jgi:hypothetical protein
VTLSATYADDIGRVRVVFSGYNADADYATVERSVDGGITYVPVRGGGLAPLTAGAGALDDYEFQAGISNMYRVSAIDSALPAALPGWTNAIGVNASVAPAIPGGLSAGNLMILVSTIRNSGAGVPVTPAGWTPIVVSGNVGVYGRVFVPGDTAPTCAFTGGVANADTIAGIWPFSNVSLTASVTNSQLNGSAQNIAVPALTTVGSKSVSMAVGWKQDDWTASTVVALPNFAHGGERISTTGDDAAIIFDYRLITTGPISMGSTSFGITGGAAAISRGLIWDMPIRAFTNQETTSVTPSLLTSLRDDQAWLKNPSRPGLNSKVTITEISEISRKSRTGRFDVLGRTLPVAITDVQSSREFTLELIVNGNAEALDMDNRLSTGEPMFLQPRTTADDIPTVYFVAGDVTRTQLAKTSTAITFTIPVIEVAAPGSTVAGATYVWSDVIANYASWTAVIAANPSWSNLIDKVSNSVVIVP